MTIKILCPCGTKFAFDVEPVQGKMPVEVPCPGCGADATGLANLEIQKQMPASSAPASVRLSIPSGASAPTSPKPAIAIAKPAPSPPVSPAPTAGPQERTPVAPPKPSAVAPPSGGTRLSVQGHATPPPPAPPAAPAPTPSVSSETPSPSPTPASQTPAAAPTLCPKHPRNPAADACVVCGKPICLECMAQFGYLCSPYCQEQARRKEIPVPVYEGQKTVQWQKEVQTGNRVLTALGIAAAGLVVFVAFYKFYLSRPKVAYSFTTPKAVPFVHAEFLGPDRFLAITPQRASVRDWKLDKEVWSTELTPPAASTPTSKRTGGIGDLELEETFMGGEAMKVRVIPPALWIATASKVLKIDLASGKKQAEIPLPNGVSSITADSTGVIATVATNPVIRTFVRVDFKSGTASTEALRLPVVRRQARPISDEFNADAPPTPSELEHEIHASGGGAVNLVGVLTEARIVQRDAVRKPKQSLLEKEGGPSAAQSLDAAMEFANENQAPVTENQSVYRVSLKRLFNGGAEWSGSVTGAPAFFPLRSIDLLVAGTTLVVFDKNTRKTWESRLNHGIGPRFLNDGFGEAADDTLGGMPAVENGARLYFFDQGTLTAFDSRDGRVAWRLPSVGITEVVPAGSSLYVASTTAGPESIEFSKDITLNQKIARVLHKVDAATGKILWSQERLGEEARASGKYLYVAMKKKFIMDDIGGGDSKLHYFLRRIDPSDGKQVWEYYQRGPADTYEANDKTLLLRFPDEIRILKYIAI